MFNKRGVFIIILSFCAFTCYLNIPKEKAEVVNNISVDAILHPYFQMYIEFLKENNIDWDKKQTIDIHIAPVLTNTNILGIAKGMNYDKGIIIWINPLFIKLPEADRKWIFFHEMTHDLFNVKHDATIIMRSYHFATTEFKFCNAKRKLGKYLKEIKDVNIQRTTNRWNQRKVLP